MNVEQIYTGCLAQAAYYIKSNGEAAIFDPLREVQPYIDKAAGDNTRIKYVFETHFHADFVSGHLDLAKKSGAEIVFGPGATPGYRAIIAIDGQKFKVGDITIKAIHTPGHTLESVTYLLIDENNQEHGIITGDTLFIGDVGRPDLAQKLTAELSPEVLAGQLYDSLRNKIMPLDDKLMVYPSHGAGSACGKNMSKETSDTLGNQKRTNYALNPALDKEQFIMQVLDGLAPPPAYFPQNVMMNMNGGASIDDVMSRGMNALEPDMFEAIAKAKGAVILDTRNAADFAGGFIPNSVNIGIDGNFAPWVGALIPDIQQEILIVTAPGREKEVVMRLARIGHDHVLGYLNGGYTAWEKSGRDTDAVRTVDARTLIETAESREISFIDIRDKSEYDTGHIAGVPNIPLNLINERQGLIDKSKTHYIHCAGGYRSMAFISILQARGYRNLININGGYKAIQECGKFNHSASE